MIISTNPAFVLVILVATIAVVVASASAPTSTIEDDSGSTDIERHLQQQSILCPAKRPENGSNNGKPCGWEEAGICYYNCCCDEDKIGTCSSWAQCQNGIVRIAMARIAGPCDLGCDVAGNPYNKKRKKKKTPNKPNEKPNKDNPIKKRKWKERKESCPTNQPRNGQRCHFKGRCKYDCCCSGENKGACKTYVECRSRQAWVSFTEVSDDTCSNFGCDAKGRVKKCPTNRPYTGQWCNWQHLQKKCEYNCCCDTGKIGKCTVNTQCIGTGESGGIVGLTLERIEGGCKQFGCDAKGNRVK